MYQQYHQPVAISNSRAQGFFGHVGVQPAQSSLQQRQPGLPSVPQSQTYLGGWVYHQWSDSWIYSQHAARKTARNLDDLHFNWGNADTLNSLSSAPTPTELVRGVTQCPSGKWQAQIYHSGKSRYIGVFDSKGEASLAYQWSVRCRQLEAFKAEHGHCNVPQRHGSLGLWVHKQRGNRKKGKLSEERVQKLDDIGFNWRAVRGSPSTWNERLDELMKYKTEHGHCNVPINYGPLGLWAGRQRAAHRKDKLSEERVQRLKDLGFEWTHVPYIVRVSVAGDPRASQGSGQTTKRTAAWDERLDNLTKYKAEHGDCNVPQRQGSLGKWVSTHKERVRKFMISASSGGPNVGSHHKSLSSL